MSFTPPESPARGTETLRTQPGTPVPFSILSVARDLVTLPGTPTSVDGLPRVSVRRDHSRQVQPYYLANCDPDPVGAPFVSDPGYPFYPFSWAVPVGCDFSHPNFERLNQIAEEDVVAATAHAVSTQLWTGASNAGQSTDSPSLPTAAFVLGGTSAEPVTLVEGLSSLAEWYNYFTRAGGGAILHIPNALIPSLMSQQLVTVNGAQMIGPAGELVSRGPGYGFSYGPDGTETASGESWIYISGPIDLRLGTPLDPANPQSIAGPLEGTANPRRNENSVIRTRRAIFTFDTGTVLAIRVECPTILGD
jgi:hypothetical protein